MASKCLTVAKLFRSNRSFTAAASPFAGRYHFFSTSAAPYSSRGKVLQSSSKGWVRRPFLIHGQNMICSAEEYEREAIVRVDMPGIGKEGVNLEMKNNSIHIEAKEEGDEDRVGRTYSGCIDLPSGFYYTEHIYASMNFGVLKIVIPKPDEMKESSLNPPPFEFRNPIETCQVLN